MNSVIPCKNPVGCNWPACDLSCNWRPGRMSNEPTIQTTSTIDWNTIIGKCQAPAKLTRKIKLAAQFAYEESASKQPGGTIGWSQEPDEIKLGWYHAAKLWMDAIDKAAATRQEENMITNSPKEFKLRKGKPRANQGP
jgi:hypothetical protein